MKRTDKTNHKTVLKNTSKNTVEKYLTVVEEKSPKVEICTKEKYSKNRYSKSEKI